MQFIDEAKIYIKAGDGGNGLVSFRREKFIDRGAPNGGDGGKGGSIILESTSHLNTLLEFRYKKYFKAENGLSGKRYNMTGKSGSSLLLKVPLGTQIFSENGILLIHDFTEDGQQFEIISGGKGGLGNSHFKSSKNRSPRKSTEGEIGHEMNIHLKLKLLSDAGLVGLPNIGKSTLLSRITAARPKIANYDFTTLKPLLGIVHFQDEEFVLADIPGLIAGAHYGKGLGDKFLKHIERCSVLVHILDANSLHLDKDYQVVRNELESYSFLLSKKTEILCINKIDSVSEDELIRKQKLLKKVAKKNVYLISGHFNIGLELVIKKILKEIQTWRNKNTFS